MGEAKLFLEVCRLTCWGGSTKGTCICAGPRFCAVRGHPRFQHWRTEALVRISRLLGNEVGCPVPTKDPSNAKR
jgi:hypothetical protein